MRRTKYCNLNRLIERIDNSRLTEKNKALLLKWSDDCLSEGTTECRIYKIVSIMFRVALRMDRSLKQAKEKHIREIVRIIQTGEYSEWTKRDYQMIIRKFYKWVGGYDTYPHCVSWIKLRSKKYLLRLPDEILTIRDVKTLVKNSRRLEDKSLIYFLYESGCRIGEIINIKVKNIEFDKNGAKVIVYGKTGSRIIRVVESAILLKKWINKKDLEDYVYPEDYATYRKRILKLSKKVKVSKRVNFHSFRHSRATHLASHLTEAQMCSFFGWVQGSDMTRTYVHLSMRDIDKAILDLYSDNRYVGA